jgi:transcriptional regulator with XRE-family HTH domain
MMPDLKISEKIYALRKEKGVTQEKLAEFLGVSTPAVSKWETNQSFPDITLLPEIASYFDVTIDYLMDFAPSLSKEEAMEIYRKLADAFSKEPFDKVYNQVKKYLKKYHSCYFLHLQMGNLLLNHLDRVDDPAKIPEIMAFTEGIFKRVILTTTNSKLKHESSYSLAVCYMFSGKPDEIISLMNDAVDTLLPPELILAPAYQLKGNTREAKVILQGYVFQCLVGLLNACPSLGMLNLDSPEKAIKWFQWVTKTMEAFEFSKVNAFGEGQMHLSYAKACAQLGRIDEALAQLEYFADVAANQANYPVTFKTSEMFDCMEGLYAKLDLGKGAHRSDKTIKESWLMAVTKDPAFAALEENERYKKIVAKIAATI